MQPIKTSHGIAILGAFLLLSLLFINWAGKQIDSIALYIPSGSQTASVANFDSNLVAHYTFDEGTGITANDSVGTNHGTLSNGVVWVDGKIGKAVSFPNANSRITTSSEFIGMGTVTVCVWLYPITAKFGGQILSNTKFSVGVSTSNRLYHGSDGIGGLSTKTNALTAGSWIHYCGVRDALGSGKTYVNGVLSTTGNTGVPTTGTQNISIGNHPFTGNNWDGYIDDMRVYNKELSSLEVASLYEDGGVITTSDDGDPAGDTDSGTQTESETTMSLPYISCGTDCYEAKTIQSVDIEAALDGALQNSGGMVKIPSGIGTITSMISRTITKDIVVTGMGQQQTILNAQYPGSSIFNFSVYGEVAFHLKSMKLTQAYSGTPASGSALVSVYGTSFRKMVSDIYFEQKAGFGRVRSLNLGSQNDSKNGGGVVFGNTFVDEGASVLSLSVFGSLATGKWDAGPEWGSPFKWYIEDNTFISHNAFIYEFMDAYRNAKFVFRRNTVTGALLGWHGFDSDPVASTHSVEVYENTFTSATISPFSLNIRGGTALIADNIFSSNFPPFFTLSHYRSGLAYHGSRCDGNSPLDKKSDTTGYPCYQQPGMTGVDGFTSSPVMEWNNKRNGQDMNFALNSHFTSPAVSRPNMIDHVKEERDYISDVTCSDGIDNDGDGMADMADITCASFWDPQLKKAIGYIKYTYPHPLRSNPKAILEIVSLTPFSADLNQDGKVNTDDLKLLTGDWNKTNSTYDLNKDGIVNSLDYVIMVQVWTG